MQDYTIQAVDETKYDADAYGNKFYSIKFTTEADAVLWKTKSRPVEGTVVFGEIRPTQSGKGKLFKKTQKPDDYIPGQTNSQPTQQSTTSHNVGGNDDVMKALRALYKQGEEIKALLEPKDVKQPGNVEEAHAQEQAQRDWNALGKNKVDEVYQPTEDELRNLFGSQPDPNDKPQTDGVPF